MKRRKGFTLIELLVVIAIIAILAAMLFPVFARARESARKIQCLSNVKNIATAVQMYLTDYAKLWPTEHRREVYDYFGTIPGGGDPASVGCRVGESSDRRDLWSAWANPYLRVPVVLDEYVRNRDVWNCPSARLVGGATFIIPGPDWVGYLQAMQGQWGESWGTGPCVTSFPSGWGGDVTDSCLQHRLAVSFTAVTGQSYDAANRAFVQAIATMEEPPVAEMKESQVNDPARFLICCDGGANVRMVSDAGVVAYPDICCVGCSGIAYFAWEEWPPLSDCGITSSECGPCFSIHANIEWARDPKKKNASARHLGGSNLGFMDGHAQWMPAASIVATASAGNLEGVWWWCDPYISRAGYTANCGAPPAGMIFLY